ncbi:exosortase B [Caldimonas sp. KR1-144]|uniref:exosortase B n=1 Tax=Caldimonas sp. KR1-144 TaxID=3400911 RepID=UPI003C0B730E
MGSAAVKPAASRSLLDKLLPVGTDPVAAALVFGGLALLYVPTIWGLAAVLWPQDEQGHGPIVFGVGLWLLYRMRDRLAALPVPGSTWSGRLIFGFALLMYAVGRSQAIWLFEVGSMIAMIAGLLQMYRGWAAVRMAWFPLFFLLFMVPLPEALVAKITGPLKAAVSAVAATVLYHVGYPVGRAGVMLTVGQYQLFVADACAGLNTMFTLEALGLLYLNLMQIRSPLRYGLLAVLLIPIAFSANVVRVMTLVLITYYFGDEAAQGFIHGFAGMLLFGVALALMLVVDALIVLAMRRFGGRPS